MLVFTGVSMMAFIADVSGLPTVYERKSIDTRMNICRTDKELPSRIVLIIIDEASLSAMNPIAGRWPWPRRVHARLIDFLSMCGARSVLFDIMFSENEFGPGFSENRGKSGDQLLIEATLSSGNVYHSAQIFHDTEDEYNKSLLNKPLPNEFRDRFKIAASGMHKGDNNNYYLPLKPLYTAAKGVGVVTFASDDDGVYRNEKLLFHYHDHAFPSLGFAPALDHYHNVIPDDDSHVLRLIGKNSDVPIPLTPDNKYYVNMYGKYGAYSFSGVFETILKLQNGDLDNLPVSPETFEGKTVYIGSSAAGVEDLKHTAMSSKTPGVLLHASIYGNILSKDFLRFTGRDINSVIFIFLQLITILPVFYFNAMMLQVVIPVFCWGLFLAFSVLLFQANRVIPVVTPLLGAILSYIASFAFMGLFEGKEKRKIKNILGQYVSPVMLSSVLESNPEEYLKAEVGVKENLTVFFSDIRGFTSITEKYPVEKVVEVLNAYLSRMVSIIFDHQGTLDKFIGDAIVAFWGAPIRLSDHHCKAVLSSIRMGEAMDSLNRDNKEKGLPPLEIGIGINTGDVILGNIGSEKKLDYTVIGDGVNLASRLEGLTKMYNSRIIISHDTYRHVKKDIACRVVDFVKVKGKNKPTLIYQVVNEKENLTADERTIVSFTQAAFDYYRQREFTSAIETYERILALKPGDFLSRLFISRCGNYLKDQPPDDWDGYYEYKTK